MPGPVQIIQIRLLIENGISSTQSAISAAVQLGDGVVKDMKFSDDDTLLALWEAEGRLPVL